MADQNKVGKLTLQLRTDTGYSADDESRISAEQWGKICAVIAGTDTLAPASTCPRGCTGPEQGGSGCVAVTGDCSDNATPAVPAVDALTRYAMFNTVSSGGGEMKKYFHGDYVKFADVQALLATPSTAPDEQKQADSAHILPPVAAPVSQHDSAVLGLFRLTLGTLALHDWKEAEKIGAQYRAIEAELAIGAARGRHACNKEGSELAHPADAGAVDYRAKLYKLVWTYFNNDCGENVYNLMESARAHFALVGAGDDAGAVAVEQAKPDPFAYDGPVVEALDELIHEITGDEGEDDPFTYLRRALAELMQLRKAADAAYDAKEGGKLASQPQATPLEATSEQVERLKAAKANLIQQARMWRGEARAQRATVLGILRRLGLPEHDWEAKRLIVNHIRKLTQSAEITTAEYAGSEQMGGAQVAKAEQVQWRNIQKVVRELATFCFGGAGESGDVSLGAAYTSLVNSLTAKDGLVVQLEPLPAPTTECAAAPAGDEDAIAQEMKRLHDALCFWLPQSHGCLPDAMQERIAADAYLLVGYDDMPDKKSAEELGWVATPRAAEGEATERKPLTDAARDVLAERQRQVEQEGWTLEHDDEHSRGELSYAACSYAVESGHLLSGMLPDASREPPFAWPWDKKWWKSGSVRRCLVKAGALILAEIERLDRIEKITGGGK